MDPNAVSDLRNVRAQGASTGDIRDFGGVKWRWSGESWQQEPRHMQSSSWQSQNIDPAEERQKQLEFAQRLQEQQVAQRKTINAPIAQSIKQGIPTLQSRYKQILSDLSTRESEEAQTTTLNTATEYSKRGIPLSSGAYNVGLEQKIQPQRRYYSGQRSSVGISEQEQIDQLNQVIATLEAGSPDTSIPQALSLYSGITGNVNQMQNQAQQSSYQQQSLAQAMEIAKMQNQPKQESPYVTLGEGQSLFNLNTLQEMFKNPKTYKAAGAGDDEWF